MPPAATSPHLRIHPVRFAALALGTDPRPHGPRRRGPASRLPCATRRRGPPQPLRSGPSVNLVPRRTSQRPHTLTARRLRRHRSAHAVRLAALVVSTPGSAFASSVRASPVTGFCTLPCTGVCSTADATARASGAALRASAAGSVSAVSTPRITSAVTGAADDDAHRRRADFVRASVFNALPRANLPTTARLVASGDIAPLAGAAVHARVVGTGFASSSLPVTPFMFTTLSTITAVSGAVPVTTKSATTPVNVSVMTIMPR